MRVWSSLRVLVALLVPNAVWCAGATIRGTVTDSTDLVLPGTVVVCYSSIGPFPYLTTTGDSGTFEFPDLVPATYFLIATRPGYQEFVHSPIVIQGAEDVLVHVNLSPATHVERVRVEERLDAPISDDPREAESFSSNVIRALPLPSDRFQELLPFLPGVVRDPRGRLNFNGTRASQSTLLVNGSTATDPVTGEFAVELPLKAVESVQVHTIPYSAEFGRVTGAVANVVTHAGNDQWDLDFDNPIPSFRVRGGKLQGISSATPQVHFSGPLSKGRAWISQGLGYRFVRSRARDMVFPGDDEEVLSGADSFTQLDLKLSEMHSLTATFSLFPSEVDNLGIDTLHPEEATPDFESNGWNFAVADKVISSSNTVWETQFAVRELDVSLEPQGSGTSRLTVDALRDNYFNELDRDAAQTELRFSRLQFLPSRFGPHVIKTGASAFYTRFTAIDRSTPIEILRADGSRSRRIEFSGSGELSGSDLGAAAYVQDQWRPSPRFGLDLGLRYEFNRVTDAHHVAPRIAVAFSPGESERTILKAGFGVFFDHVFVHAAEFERFQQRTEIFYDDDGAPSGPPRAFQNRIATEGLRLPKSTAWHVELDQALTESWILRAAYRERHGSREMVVDRITSGPEAPALLLSSRGRSTSKEFDVTLRWDLPGRDELFFSFARTRADGDLNDFGHLYGNVREPLILESEKSNKSFDVPERFLAWGVFGIRGGWTVAPGIEWRTGFPYTVFNEDYNVVGSRNRGGRLPDFFSADVRFTKQIELFGKDARIGFQVLNLTGHFNPRDIISNQASADFLTVRNSVGFSLTPRFQVGF